jgi:tetratricopeptide (TPR) repeat protein
MANLDKFKEKARKFEQKEQWAKAIEEYVRAIEQMEAAPESSDADLSLFNRVGDLYQKVGDTQNAVAYYERAVDKYVDGGLANNAIALCNKVLRIAPGHSQVYLKLGILFASKGFAAEAKTNLLEYADRMQKAGQVEEAFKALKKFAEMTPGQTEIWSVLAQQARASAKTPEQQEQVEKLLSEFDAKDKVAHPRKSRMSRHQLTGEELPVEEPSRRGELVFLDLEPTPPRKGAPVQAPVEEALAPAPPLEPEVETLEIEQTSLAADEEVEPSVPSLEIQSTSFAEVEESPSGPSLDLEPTSLAEPELEEAVPAGGAAEGPVADMELLDLEAPAEEEPAAAAIEGLPMLDMGEPTVVAEPEAADGAGAGLEMAAPELEIPGASGLEIEEPLLAEAEAPGAGSPLEFLDLGEAVAAPLVEDLEGRIRDNPQDWEAHRLLGEGLVEQGERERGIGELDAALDGLELGNELQAAYALAEEVLRLEPNSVRHHQKRVELAYRQGDRSRLAGAYLELADALLRSGEADKAVAVYQRVLEHDPGSVRARLAVETLAPPAPAKPPAPAAPARPGRAEMTPPSGGFVDLGAMLLDEEGPKDTRMRIEDEEPSGDEQKDFQTMLNAFKKGVEANVEEEDFQSHYDLGVAYKELGLLDEAIAEFQKALRGSEGRLKASEALGLCFFEKGQFAVAETILRRALELPAAGDAERVGLLYWLGRAQEELGKSPDALASYNRVFAVEINFQDVSQRVKSLAHAEHR